MVEQMSQMARVMKISSIKRQKKSIVFPGSNSLFGKLLLPVIGIMLLSMVVTGLVFNYGIRATSRRILEQEVQSDNQKIIQSLGGRI